MLTFNPEGGSLGGLPETGKGIELQMGRQGLNQANGHCTFAFAQWGGGYTRQTDNMDRF